jgi:hypothetical protein
MKTSTHDFEPYIRYRFRVAELIDLLEVRKSAKRQLALAPLVPTLDLAMVTWLASMMDQKALQTFPVWKFLFPSAKENVKRFVKDQKQRIDEIVAFRHKTGAHATGLEEQTEVRFRAMRPGLGRFIDEFLTMARSIASLEPTIPELKSELLDWRLMPGSLDTFERAARGTG